ncbi:PREDICTED: mitochondrial uncoupling protein 2-like [Phaethon lepturus]|uniref:mitochondrial uncoupling protein 2-like n=1 Tax=Phaethon lepturus TaxID=97097 RepID=UPI0005306799|nr:PREDICTED: mitochondrial uncoupling protein 2-like [Phaethon lepturus]
MPPPSCTGTLPNIARNAIVNCGELVTYALLKDALLRAPLPGQYRNALSCLLALLMQDGLAGLYKGFVPSFLRLGSWNIMMFITWEQLKRGQQKLP